MCGICGELRLDGHAGQLAVVERMLPKLAYRGPDFEGTWQAGPMALGQLQRVEVRGRLLPFFGTGDFVTQAEMASFAVSPFWNRRPLPC